MAGLSRLVPGVAQRVPPAAPSASFADLVFRLRRRDIPCAPRAAHSTDAGLRTCRHCKEQFDPATNGPEACRRHTAHFGGESARKFESAFTGGTSDTPGSGRVVAYWHCCGAPEFDAPGCTASPHVGFGD